MLTPCRRAVTRSNRVRRVPNNRTMEETILATIVFARLKQFVNANCLSLYSLYLHYLLFQLLSLNSIKSQIAILF